MKAYYFYRLLCLYLFGFSLTAFAQKDGKYNAGNWLFLKSEQAKKAKLSKADAYEIYYIANALSSRTNRENALFAFNDKGNYLIVEDIPQDTLLAQKYIEDFYKQPATNKDLIILTRPLQIIKASLITYANDAINYKNEQGESESISNERAIALLFKEGNFRLYGKAIDVVSSLKEVRKANKPTPMSDEEKAENRDKGIQTLATFNDYLQILCDKRETPSRKRDAENRILALFIKEASVGVVSKKNPKDVRSYPIKDYLYKMRNRPYESIELNWVDVNYIEEPKPLGDGSYQGKIRGEQRFSGLDKKGKVQYEDMTEKDIIVKFRPYMKIVGGVDKRYWQTLLGNISVVDVWGN